MKNKYDNLFSKTAKLNKWKPDFKIKEEEFPVFFSNNKIEANIFNENTFANMVLKKIPDIQIIDELPSGWISFKQDKNTRQVINVDKTKTEIIKEDDSIEKMIKILERNQEKYIEYYDSLYFTGAYKEFHFYSDLMYDYEEIE